jgi:electron transfer flavoprotein beta subunit
VTIDVKLFVLLKQTFDTEEKIRIRNGRIEQDGVKLVINPYDEYAVEEALRQRDILGGAVTVVTVGTERSVEALRSALAMGADDAVLIEQPDGPVDEAVIAKLLHAFLRGQSADVLLGGHFSIDSGSGQVALRVAEQLGIPHVGAVTKLTIDGSTQAVTAIRDAEGDEVTIETALPACFTAQQGLNDPRYATLPGIMKAKKKPFKRISAADLGLSASELSPCTEVSELYAPASRQSGRRIGGDAAEQARELVRALHEDEKLI